jgi:hypothetical protein
MFRKYAARCARQQAYSFADGVSYNLEVLYWECKRRLNMLRTFRQLTTTYFIYTHFTNMGRLVEQQEAVEAREQINLRIGNVLESCALIGHTMSMNYTPPPATRLAGFTINIIKDMFQFDRLRVPRRVVFDYLDSVDKSSLRSQQGWESRALASRNSPTHILCRSLSLL